MRNRKYTPPKDRLGIRSFISRTVALTPKKLFIGKAAFKLLIFSAPLGKIPLISWLYKKILLMSSSDFSQGYSFPLNIEITDTDKQVVMPADLMKKAIRDARYRAIMTSCICREAQDCKNYPKDIGCIFLGEAAEACVRNGIAKEATAEECYLHLEKAASHGLSGQALWVEVEKYLWGFETKNARKFLEFCFCCPCCCTGFRFAKRTGREARLLFHRTSGWVAEIDTDKCVKCMACQAICPRHAVDSVYGLVTVNEDCGGCGLCIPKCSTGAIKLVAISDMKADLKDYFDELDLKV